MSEINKMNIELGQKKAKEYAIQMHKNCEELHGHKCTISDMYYRNADIEVAYETGWEEAIKNLWIKVEDELPNNSDEFLFLLIKGTYANSDDFTYITMMGIYNDNKFNIESRHLKVIAWMPCPNFEHVITNDKEGKE